MEYIYRMGRDVRGRADAGITHDRYPGPDLLILAHVFRVGYLSVRERVVGPELMADLVGYVIDVEVVPFRNIVGRRGDTHPLVVIVAAHATDAAGVPAATRCAEHVADVVHRRCDALCRDCARELIVPRTEVVRVWIGRRVVEDQAGRLGDEVQVKAEVSFINPVRACKRGVDAGQYQLDLCRARCPEVIRVFAVDRLRQPHRSYLAGVCGEPLAGDLLLPAGKESELHGSIAGPRQLACLSRRSEHGIHTAISRIRFDYLGLSLCTE